MSQPVEESDRRNYSGSNGRAETRRRNLCIDHRDSRNRRAVDKLLGVASSWFGMSEPLSIVRVLGWLFYPFAFLLGNSIERCPNRGALLGERVILTEVFSYNHLAQAISSGQITDPRTVVILSYALCGFAHVAAMAIFVGGTAALAPTRRDDLASLGLRALVAATLATLMTGCIAGCSVTARACWLLVHEVNLALRLVRL
jgi:nucleoside permease NupC